MQKSSKMVLMIAYQYEEKHSEGLQCQALRSTRSLEAVFWSSGSSLESAGLLLPEEDHMERFARHGHMNPGCSNVFDHPAAVASEQQQY
eukprot:Gb_33926 [translate_table: standard]